MRAKRRLIVVDDHPIVREALRDLLNREQDMTVIGEAANPAEAMRLAAAERLDGAVVDLALGTHSGMELIAQLRQRQPWMAILTLSMYDELLYAERVLRAGANGYVMKHEPSAHIVDAVRQVLDGRAVVSASVTERLLRMVAGERTGRASGVEALTDRELEVFRLVGLGVSTVRIGKRLHISPKTVETYRLRIKKKLGVETAGELLLHAARFVEEKGSEKADEKDDDGGREVAAFSSAAR